jgi:Ribulose-5-phosphate 4-epimerase and related epimerases and aldolases
MLEQLKEQVWKANLLLPHYKLVTFTWGNVSGIDREKGLFVIKPSGVDYDKLKPEDIVIVGLDGKIADGKLRPSSDTNTHLELYKAFPTIGGIVHTHSTFAVAWAQAARAVPLYGTTHADHLAADIPCTEFMADDRIRNDYETETGLQIIDCFEKHNLNAAEIPMALVAGHGPFTWGKNAEKAVYHARVLEELCKMAYITELVNPKVQRLKDSLIQKHYNRKHGKDAYYGQN